MILNDELQIMAKDSVPIVKGKEIEFVSWYKVTPEKVIVCHYEDCEDKVEEFDICDVELSGLPPGYFDADLDYPDVDAQWCAAQQEERLCHCASHMTKGFRDQWIAKGKWKPAYEKAWQATHPGEADKCM